MHTLNLRFFSAIILTIFFVIGQFQGVFAQTLSQQINDLLRNRIEAAGAPPRIAVGEEVLHASVMLPLFYERRMYSPAWSNTDGPLPTAEVLIGEIHKSDREGLRPDDYHLGEIEEMLKVIHQDQKRKSTPNPGMLADLDLLLTDAFLIYGSHLLAGKVDPEKIDAEWIANRREKDMAQVLEKALSSMQIEETLKTILPSQPGYKRLRDALAHYRNIAQKGGWPVITEGPKMQKGDRGERVVLLRNRLIANSNLESRREGDQELFDDGLEQAVREFQKRHALSIDGIVGDATLKALNISAEERVRQIELNMERWRWLPEQLGERFILVNIANFELDVFENGQKVMGMRAVVGRHYRRTPVFSDRMTYLVLNPYWHIPTNIAQLDILPQIRKDPDHLAKLKIKVFQGWGAEANEIDPETIDWSEVKVKNSGYRFRQEPGPMNSLGRVKFMFPNKFNVYLHDTPSRKLFAKSQRAFSSGCIRIEKAIELAEYLLRSDPNWTKEKILAEIDKDVEKTISLPEPILVHLLYWTAWADEDGSVQFRDDIYARDNLLDKALQEKPPTK